MADDNPNTPYAPPGYRALIAVVAEFGPDRVRRWLAEPCMEAFDFNPRIGETSREIDVRRWRSDEAVEVLRTGTYKNFVLIVRDFDFRTPPDFVPHWPDEREGWPPPSTEPAEPAAPVPEVTPAPPSDITPAVSPPEQGNPVLRRARRGRKPYDVWPDLYNYLDSVVAEEGRKFPSYLKAAEIGWIWLAEQEGNRRRKKKGAATPAVDTIREKIALERPDLAEND
jgi:hypothetical protein